MPSKATSDTTCLVRRRAHRALGADRRVQRQGIAGPGQDLGGDLGAVRPPAVDPGQVRGHPVVPVASLTTRLPTGDRRGRRRGTRRERVASMFGPGHALDASRETRRSPTANRPGAPSTTSHSSPSLRLVTRSEMLGATPRGDTFLRGTTAWDRGRWTARRESRWRVTGKAMASSRTTWPEPLCVADARRFPRTRSAPDTEDRSPRDRPHGRRPA